MELEFWWPIIILGDKTQVPESCEIFGYYYGPDPNKGALECSCFWIEYHGLLARYFLWRAYIPTDINLCMVPVSWETKKESPNIEPVNFILDDEVEDGTDDTLTYISYKDAINIIQHVHGIIDH